MSTRRPGSSPRPPGTTHRVEFRVGDARDLPVPDADADVVVSGLAATGPIRLTARAWAVRGTA